ncbi:hypothetical protein RhiirA5_439346 [Rhizophagus irregularis]|uniref:Serine-threonine/tyrosine-protein kinase catalytic domain-containing protein n=1 Tax=Rhizophagus irregularis TaxID=588596 RepID=A0A2N0NHY6_9GLOM|nr:hypothetical protein RhiirA5_439346 [Rhizophagus irregularis]
MKKCWHSDPEKRPTAAKVLKKIETIQNKEWQNETEIIESLDIGPVMTNNPVAIYKSRYLSGMIKSAISTRSLRSQSITSELDQFDFYQNPNNKRKFDDNQSENNFDNGENIKKTKLIENENNCKDYVTKEIKFDINTNSKPNDDKYTTREIGFDI